MILCPPQLLQDLDTSTIFLDTNVFSIAARSKDFLRLLVSLKNEANCALTTISSVVFEVTNGSSSLEIYNQRADFITGLVNAINPMKFLDNIPDPRALPASYPRHPWTGRQSPVIHELPLKLFIGSAYP